MSIPNILSIIRIILVPVFGSIYLTAQSQPWFYISAAILVVSGLTDLLDGFIARKYNMITELGKFLDPFADKLTQFVVSICLAIRYKPFVYLCVLIFLKELAMLIGGMILLKKKHAMVSSKWFGKAATFIIYLIMVLVCSQPKISNQMAVTAVVSIAVLVLFALGMYIPVYLRIRKNSFAVPKE